MNTSHLQKVALVTGASRGIGRAIALRLAADGHAVAINYVHRQSEAESVVAAIVADGGKAIAVPADIADPKQATELFARTAGQLGRIDALINNAGIIQPGNVALADTDDALYERLFAINTRGTFNMLRLAARQMNDGGRIVNFSSSVIGLALPGYAVYAAAKAAVETMTNIFAKELRGRQITVNAIAPGPTATELFLDGKSADAIERLALAAPLERLGTPQDIANTVAFLISPSGGWINGQTLRANGGIV